MKVGTLRQIQSVGVTQFVRQHLLWEWTDNVSGWYLLQMNSNCYMSKLEDFYLRQLVKKTHHHQFYFTGEMYSAFLHWIRIFKVNYHELGQISFTRECFWKKRENGVRGLWVVVADYCTWAGKLQVGQRWKKERSKGMKGLQASIGISTPWSAETWTDVKQIRLDATQVEAGSCPLRG